MKLPILVFLFAFTLFSYLDKILLGEVQRFENALLSAILAGITFLFQLLIKKTRRP